MVGCVGGGTRAGSSSGSGWPSRTVQSSFLVCVGFPVMHWFWGVWYWSRLRFRCRAAVEKGSKVWYAAMRRSYRAYVGAGRGT